MVILKTANLAMRFFLELCILGAVGYWGFQLEGGLFLNLVAGIGLPILIAFIWGIFLAPASPRRLHGLSFWGLELIIFGLATTALFAAKQPVLALVFFLIYVINKILIIIWRQ